MESPEKDAGSTALAVLVVGSLVLVANAGDSRAVLSRRGKAIDLSRDHKPSCPSERERISLAGTPSPPVPLIRAVESAHLGQDG